MRLRVLALSLALLGVAAGPAMANEKDDGDIRCIVAFLNQAGADNTKADTATYIAAYFYGKLFTRNPGKPPASLVSDRALPANHDALQADLTRCAREFAEAKVKIDALNAELLERAKKSGGPVSAPAPATTPTLPDIGAPKLWPGQIVPDHP